MNAFTEYSMIPRDHEKLSKQCKCMRLARVGKVEYLLVSNRLLKFQPEHSIPQFAGGTGYYFRTDEIFETLKKQLQFFKVVQTQPCQV